MVKKEIRIRAVARYPYLLGRVSPLLRFRRLGHKFKHIKPLRNLSKFIIKIPHHWLHFPIRGTFGLKTHDKTVWINVATANFGIETVLTWPPDVLDPQIRAIIDLFVPDDGIFFDIGANWGFFTLFAASRPGFTGQVHAFEPYPPTIEELSSNITQSGLGQVVTLHGAALSDRNGTAKMTVPQRNNTAMASIGEGNIGLSVKLCRLDDLPLPAPAVIKLDAEGHEHEVLMGARGTIEKHKPLIVFESLMLPHEVDKSIALIQLLEDWNYRIYIPRYVRGGHDQPGQLCFTEIQASNRKEFPGFQDLCAIHRDRIDETQLSRAI